MKEYYKLIDVDKSKEVKKEELEDTTTAFEKLAKKMDKEIMNAHELGLDFHDCFKNLDR